jgi:prepilin-type N-terminal cleavage/methylation domain-containing protein
MQQIASLNKRFKSPLPPFIKGGLGGGRGLTLVEVMIALTVVLVVFLALMQTALVCIDSNMINTLRSEAVNIAEMRMNEARNAPFTSLVSDTGSPSSNYDSSCDSGCNDCPPTGFSTGECRCRDVRSISDFKFCTNLTCTEFGGDGNCATDDSDNKQVNITVGWKWKGENYTHRITTVRGKQ